MSFALRLRLLNALGSGFNILAHNTVRMSWQGRAVWSNHCSVSADAETEAQGVQALPLADKLKVSGLGGTSYHSRVVDSECATRLIATSVANDTSRTRMLVLTWFHFIILYPSFSFCR